MTQPLLELRQITVSFDGFLALRELNLTLQPGDCLLYTSPSPRDLSTSRMPSSA